MANTNSANGYVAVPAQVITGTTETAIKVPASGMFGLPSAIMASGAGLVLSVPKDMADGKPFRIRVAGKVHTGASLTFLPKLYQVPNSIFAAGTQATVSNDTAVVTCAASTAFSGDGNFMLEAVFIWDSTSKVLNGAVTLAQINGVANAVNSGTAGTRVVTSQVTSVGDSDLKFMVSATFGTANAANSVTITNFVVDQM